MTAVLYLLIRVWSDGSKGGRGRGPFGGGGAGAEQQHAGGGRRRQRRRRRRRQGGVGGGAMAQGRRRRSVRRRHGGAASSGHAGSGGARRPKPVGDEQQRRRRRIAQRRHCGGHASDAASATAGEAMPARAARHRHSGYGEQAISRIRLRAKVEIRNARCPSSLIRSATPAVAAAASPLLKGARPHTSSSHAN